jgi:predicted dithiol-disulfide oxidoreductase (DUF899 family)
VTEGRNAARSFAQVRPVYNPAHPVLAGRGGGIDLLTPTYHILDLTPAGRGEWDPSNEEFDASLRELSAEV